jgi:predicted HicB family RNase H-like nuclease
MKTEAAISETDMPSKKKPAPTDAARRRRAGQKSVMVWFGPVAHARLRLAAARAGIPMAAFAYGAILDRVTHWERNERPTE